MIDERTIACKDSLIARQLFRCLTPFPDGKRVAFLSFSKDIAYVYGGQGTINVPILGSRQPTPGVCRQYKIGAKLGLRFNLS